ncbi:substrate-binding periplasmic protein [Zooshikella sp. RANM57]|uniref:substrate-binding periplasmic protein n=1 Tax=Zooshikella sp. RANM57 TaxID=3425863 RepID=UPI003D6EFEB6
MKLLYKVIVLTCCGWGLLYAFANAASSQENVVRLTNGEWPPFLSEHYKNYGAASDIVSQAFELEGINIQYGFFMWDKAMNLAAAGEWDGSLVWTWNEERERLFYYSDPVITLRTVFFHRVDTVFDWKEWSDLKGKRVGATRGYYYGEDFKQAESSQLIEVIRQDTDLDNFKKLLRRKMDLFVIDTEIGYELLNTHFPPGIRQLVTSHPKPLRETSFHLLLSKKVKYSQQWMRLFNKGLKELKSRGEYDRILDDVIQGAYRLPQKNN